MKHTIWQFTKFSVVGGTSALLNYVVIVLAVEVFGAGYMLAKIPGFVISVAFNYVLNSNMTFRVSAHCIHQLTRYLTVLLSGFVLNMMLSKLVVSYLVSEQGALVEVWGHHIRWYMLVEIVMMGLFSIWNFVGHKFWSFKGCRRESVN